jgi:hypothetical protein
MRADNMDDVMVDMTHAAVPLASLLANFLPFVIFHVKRFLDNQFAEEVPVIDKKGNLKYMRIDDAPLVYSDEVIKDEIDNFIHSYSNRFKPFTYTTPDKEIMSFRFLGINCKPEEYKRLKDEGLPLPYIDRKLTWCDIFFMAVTEATKDKCVLITRYPMNYNVA